MTDITLTLGEVSREVSLVLDDVCESLVGAESHVEVGESLRHGPPQPALPRESDELLVVRPLSLALLHGVFVQLKLYKDHRDEFNTLKPP